MTSDQDSTAKKLGAAMTIGAWVVVVLLLTMYFSGWLDTRYHPNQQVEGKVYAGGVREVVLKQNYDGHYIADGRINGVKVRYLLDTGATEVSIPLALAERLALHRGAARSMQTANGAITTYSTWLDTVELGTIELSHIRAHINPHMGGNEVLLGMSFLRHLELIQRDGRLTLRQR